MARRSRFRAGGLEKLNRLSRTIQTLRQIKVVVAALPKSLLRLHGAGKCWERGRLVRIPLTAYYSHSEDNDRFFALRAQCGRDVRVPSNQTGFFGSPVVASRAPRALP